MSWEQDKRRREAKTGEKTREPTREGGSPSERQRGPGPGPPCFSRERQGLGLGPNAAPAAWTQPGRSSGLSGRSAKWNLDGTGLRTHHTPCTEAELRPAEASGGGWKGGWSGRGRGPTSQIPLPTGLWPGEGRSTSPNKRSSRIEREEVSRSENHAETAS